MRIGIAALVAVLACFSALHFMADAKRPVRAVRPQPKLPLPKDPEHIAHYPIPLLPTPKAFKLSALTKPQTRPFRHPDDKLAWVNLPHVIPQYMQLAQGVMEKVNGIVVHQTYEPTFESTWAIWDRPEPKDKVGTHFIISPEGKIYQTTGLRNFTYHVGKIRKRCHSSDPCSCWEAGNPTMSVQVNDQEKDKPYPLRNLRNIDSIGIEVVRTADLKVNGTGDEAYIYRNNFHAQNYALTWLVKSLRLTYQEPGKPALEVARHPCIAWGKQRTEARSCNWDWTFQAIEPRYRPTNRPLFGEPPKPAPATRQAQPAKKPASPKKKTR